MLDQIEELYEVYRSTASESEKKALYTEIDSLSYLASTYAISKEFSNIMQEMGISFLNAYTHFDKTGYVNNLPANQLEKWIILEAERFRNSVFRSFHTELETVYEEMNTILDDGPRYALFQLSEELYKGHPYATQTAIGQIAHLKNPSIKAIKEYYHTYYVPNNMAIIIAGDFDLAYAHQLILENWGDMKRKPLPPTVEYNSKLNKNHRNIFAPGGDMLRMGFRFPGIASREHDLATILDVMLANGSAGLFDLNLKKASKVQDAGSFVEGMTDFTVHQMYGYPKEGQSLDELKQLMLNEIERLKAGDFEEWLVEAAINFLIKYDLQNLENVNGLNSILAEVFIHDMDWMERLKRYEKLKGLTVQDIIEFVSENYRDNVATVYKYNGETENKIVKPEINPIETNESEKSAFRIALNDVSVTPIQENFLVFEEAMSHLELESGSSLKYIKNDDNALFNLEISFPVGYHDDPVLAFALNNYLQKAYTAKYNFKEIEEAFFQMGCSYSVNVRQKETEIYLSGLTDQFKPALSLLTYLLMNMSADDMILQEVIEQEFQSRLNTAKITRQMASAGIDYMTRKARHSTTLSSAELKNLHAETLTDNIREMLAYSRTYYLYSSDPIAEAKQSIEEIIESEWKPQITEWKSTEFPALESKADEVLFIPVSGGKQVVMRLIGKIKSGYDTERIAEMYLLWKYLSGTITNEIREKNAFAYSAYAQTVFPTYDPMNTFTYIAMDSQADKYQDALSKALEILRERAINEEYFNTQREGYATLRSWRVNGNNIFYEYQLARQRGLDRDFRYDLYHNAIDMPYDHFIEFYDEYIRNIKMKIVVVGDPEVVKVEDLKRFGQVTVIKPEELLKAESP